MLRFVKIIIALIISLLLTYFLQANYIVKFISQVIGVIIWLGILTSNQEFYFKSIWLIIIVVNPFAGIILYIAFGLDYRSTRLYAKKVKNDLLFESYNQYNQSYALNDKWQRIMHHIGKRKIYQNSELILLENGEIKFKHLIESIKKAKKFIHLEYYIIHRGKLYDELIDELAKKAKTGVKVRIIGDGLGCFKIDADEIKRLKQLGIELIKFSKIKNPFFNEKLNFRNHRKIAVIDNEIGYVGGINIGDEYIGCSKKYGIWHDTHLAIKGDGIYDLQLTFIKDWYYETKENLLEEDPELLKFNKIVSDDLIQITPSGADNKDFAIKDMFFKLITTAQKEIVIMTPYLVPDFDVIRALVTAAKNGVLVKIIVPGIPDRKIVGIINHSYYEELLKVGIEIYEVKATFVHSKVMLIDEELAMIGTTNLDFRSFNLNFEITTFLKSKKVVSQMQKVCRKDYENSKKISYDEYLNEQNIVKNLIQKVVQLFAPFF